MLIADMLNSIFIEFFKNRTPWTCWIKWATFPSGYLKFNNHGYLKFNSHFKVEWSVFSTNFWPNRYFWKCFIGPSLRHNRSALVKLVSIEIGNPCKNLENPTIWRLFYRLGNPVAWLRQGFCMSWGMKIRSAKCRSHQMFAVRHIMSKGFQN